MGKLTIVLLKLIIMFVHLEALELLIYNHMRKFHKVDFITRCNEIGQLKPKKKGKEEAKSPVKPKKHVEKEETPSRNPFCTSPNRIVVKKEPDVSSDSDSDVMLSDCDDESICPSYSFILIYHR